jgi:hypothetical protein
MVAEYVRRAVSGDVDAITALASDRRSRHARYQPVFWRPAANAEDVHRPYLAELVSNDDVLTLVSDGTVAGFLIATFGDAPAVYDPEAGPAPSTTSWLPRPVAHHRCEALENRH